MTEDATLHPPGAAPETGLATPALAARGLVKTFRSGERTLEILRSADLVVQPGELVALVGPSGAGKSTLLHVLGLLERPDAGEVEIAGRACWALSPNDRAAVRNTDVGFVFQFYHLIPELTAVENVLLPTMIRHSLGAYLRRKRELVERAEDLLVRFGLGERLAHRPSRLSGGERQRVAIARALFHDPGLLLADEPTGNLDRETGERVLELLLAEQRRRRLSLLLVTHDDELAARCDRAVRMLDGRVVDDPPAA